MYGVYGIGVEIFMGYLANNKKLMINIKLISTLKNYTWSLLLFVFEKNY